MIEEEIVAVGSFRCRGCGYRSNTTWYGNACPGCGRWLNIRKMGSTADEAKSTLAALSVLPDPQRISSGIPEFDVVIGGGFVVGSTSVMSAKQGSGKTTVCLAMCDFISRTGRPVLYAAGEMSGRDLGLYAKRIGITGDNVHVMGLEGDISAILSRAEELKAKFLVVDSLKTAYLDGAPGSSIQCENVTKFVVNWAKRTNTIVILLMHVDKQGELAGSTGIAHAVDVVIELDPCVPKGTRVRDDQNSPYRILRLDKNRWGKDSPVAFFEMTEKGLVPLPASERKKSKWLIDGESDDT